MKINVAGLKVQGASALLLACLLVSFAGTPVSAAGLIPLNNPKTNFTPHPNFLTTVSCTSAPGGWSCANPCASSQTASLPVYTNNPTCTQYLLHIINAARKRENVKPMVLPTNWYSLSAGEQLFVLADLERTARGLPPYLGINRVLDSSAQRAAQIGTDPSVAPGFPIGLDAHVVDGIYDTGGGLRVDVQRRVERKPRHYLQRSLHLCARGRLLGTPRRTAWLRRAVQPRGGTVVPELRNGNWLRQSARPELVCRSGGVTGDRRATHDLHVGQERRAVSDVLTVARLRPERISPRLP